MAEKLLENYKRSACQKEDFVYNVEKLELGIRRAMKRFPILFSLVVLFALSSCSPKEEEQEPDYENLVMADDEDEWTPGQEREGSAIADLDPQEFMIRDPELKTENASEGLP